MSDQSQPVVEVPAAAPLAVGQLIAAFLSLRDKKKAMAERHRAEMAPLNELLERVDSALLAHCIANGIDSVRDKAIGSATKATKTNASIERPDEFRQFVIATEAWDMVNWSANVEAVTSYADAHKVLPPGVKLSSYQHMNVRKATKKAASAVGSADDTE